MAKKKSRGHQPKKGLDLTSELLNDRFVAPTAQKTSVTKNGLLDDHEDDEGKPLDQRLAQKVLTIGNQQFTDDLDDMDQQDLQYFEEEEDEEDNFIAPESLGGLTDEAAQYWMNNTGAGLGAAEKIYEALRKCLAESRDQTAKKQTAAEAERESQVHNAYAQMANILRRYKCGKLPKLLKMLPMIKEWEYLLSLTGYRKWTPQALYEITKIFASNAKEAQAQRFYNLFLLPAVLTEINKKGKVHVCTYKSLMKAAFKCKAFMRGIVLPVAFDGCSYKDAMVLGSVISKLSFPNDVLYLTLDKLFETRPFPDPMVGGPQWWAVTSIFMCIMLEKNAQLPTQVVENAVKFIESFDGLSERPPLVWYQGIIALCERYRDRIDKQQEQRIRYIVKQHPHPVVEGVIRALNQINIMTD